MKYLLPTVFFLFALILLSTSCEKIRQLPPEPVIEFRQFSMYDSIDPLGNNSKVGILEFYFEDGDGDLGLEEGTDDENDTVNLFFTLYRKTDGVFTEVTTEDDDPNYPSGYRIPYLEREGQNKVLQGTAEITFFYFFYDPADTIRYDFYIKDRAGNESNVETTCEIPFSLEGKCIREE